MSVTVEMAKKIEPNDKRTTALRDIALTYAQAGRYESSLQVASEIPDEVTKATTLAAIASMCQDRGPRDEARRFVDQTVATIRRITDPRDAAQAFTLIAGNYMSVVGIDTLLTLAQSIGPKSGGVVVFPEVGTAIPHLPPSVERAMALARVAEHCAEEDSQVASRFLSAALQATIGIQDQIEKIMVLTTIGSTLEKAGIGLTDQDKSNLKWIMLSAWKSQ